MPDLLTLTSPRTPPAENVAITYISTWQGWVYLAT